MSIFALRPTQRKSPDPMIVSLSREEAFTKFYAYVSKKQLDFLVWTIREREMGRFVVADLQYSEEFENKSIRCDAVVNFDFSSVSQDKTKLRWSCEYKHWCDAKTARRMEGHITSWLQALFEKTVNPIRDAKVKEGVGQLQDSPPEASPPLELECQFHCRRPIDLTFERIHARLLNAVETSQSWKIVLMKAAPPNLMNCEFQVMDESKGLMTIAILAIGFATENGKQTVVTWTYFPNDVLAFNDHKQAKERADDWIRLVLTA